MRSWFVFWLKTMRRCLARIIRDRSHKPIAAGVAAAALVVVCLQAASDPLADLKASASALDAKRYAAAATSLSGLSKQLPKLADYVAWLEASAQFGLRNYAVVPAALDPVWKQTPSSPLAAKAYLLAAQALVLNNSAQAAVDLLRKNYAALPLPQADLALAQALYGAGDAAKAAVYDQRVYFGYPTSAQATDAGADLARLHSEMGDNYPPPM